MADAEAPASGPTPWTRAVFVTKARIHQLRRAMLDVAFGPRHLGSVGLEDYSVLLGRSHTLLLLDRRLEERRYQLGKVENLRRAALGFDGVGAPAGAVLSFWRQVGPATAARGFVVGRMLQEGCVVPAVGGGLCQLSNALFDVAMQAGCEIVERHAHSRRVAGSAAALGRDATVAWNYVDFRFRPRRALRVSVSVGANHLEVTARGREQDGPPGPPTALSDIPALLPAFAESCATCGDAACFRHEGADHPATIAAPIPDPGATLR